MSTPFIHEPKLDSTTVAVTRMVRISVFTGLLVTLTPSAAYSQVEVEADPIAYVLNGYSGHLAYVFDPARVSVGVFGVDVPQFFHGNEGWDLRSRGATVKVDYLISKLKGLFVGIDTGYQRSEYTLESAEETEDQDLFGAGVRTGYRYFFRDTGFYVVPWVSVSYQFNAEDIVINGERFEQGQVQVFPTLHLGWRF